MSRLETRDSSKSMLWGPCDVNAVSTVACYRGLETEGGRRTEYSSTTGQESSRVHTSKYVRLRVPCGASLWSLRVCVPLPEPRSPVIN